jgi:ABC-type multidrug transport system ATPase subunit
MRDLKQSGILNPGDIYAVLGASGAGKSTFLDVIAGRKSSDQARKVYVNGDSNFKMKHNSKYCTQEDALFGNLTVKETLTYAGDFNLPQTMNRKDKSKIAKDVSTKISAFSWQI